METTRFICKVYQCVQPDLRRSEEEEDKLVIRVRLNRNIAGMFRLSMDPGPKICLHSSKRDIKVSFSHMKQQLQSRDNIKEYEDLILEALKDINFPRERHKETVVEIFKVVEEAVSPKMPILAAGAYVSYVLGGTTTAHFVTMAPVRVGLTEKSDSCPICLNDLVAEEDDIDKPLWDLKRLPCRHLFHKDCLSQWLQENHTCPTCRYKIPTGDDNRLSPDQVFRNHTQTQTRFRPY